MALRMIATPWAAVAPCMAPNPYDRLPLRDCGFSFRALTNTNVHERSAPSSRYSTSGNSRRRTSYSFLSLMQRFKNEELGRARDLCEFLIYRKDSTPNRDVPSFLPFSSAPARIREGRVQAFPSFFAAFRGLHCPLQSPTPMSPTLSSASIHFIDKMTRNTHNPVPHYSYHALSSLKPCAVLYVVRDCMST